ncbi:hypothetical protein V1511DRAFT_497086 [Dipodascopsis uninucleata]
MPSDASISDIEIRDPEIGLVDTSKIVPESSTGVSTPSLAKPVAIFKKKGLIRGGTNSRKRTTRVIESSSSDDSSSDGFSDEDKDDKRSEKIKSLGASKKRIRVGGISDTITSSSNGMKAGKTDIGSVEHQASGSTDVSNSTDIFKTSAIYDEDFLLGDKKKYEQDLKAGSKSASETDQRDIYKGNANYAKFITSRESLRKVGPMKSASNIRSTTVVDFQPDVCKDYKQTGFCGYGDSCKFLHIRENYKAGWQLDREWEEVQKKKSGNK